MNQANKDNLDIPSQKEVDTLVLQSQRSALVLGQIQGKIHNMLSFYCPEQVGLLHGKLLDLHNYIIQMAAELYYPEEKK